MTKQKYS